MAYQIFTQPSQQALDVAANVLSGATLSFTLTGTSTPTNAFSDSTLTTPLANPLSANSAGVWVSIFLDPNIIYKVVLKTSGGAVLQTWDPANEQVLTSASISLLITSTYIGTTLDSLKRTAAEITASAVPVNYAYPPGDSRRFAPDTTGTTDVTATLQAMLDAAGIAANSANGQIVEVTIYPGTYKITRLYMRYSNVWLRLVPGAALKQTQTGITNNNTAGQSPAYAVLHINPLTYVNSPGSGAAGTLTNVRIYGGGTVQGPYTSTHAYDGFAMGIASNDCHKCWIEGILVQGCGGENILLNPSAFTTCSDLRIMGCEVNQGGEVGINNARDFLILDNYVHDSWSQNGVGGNGDGGFVCFNRIRGMAGGGITLGGSGAADIGACRNVTIGFNELVNINVTSGGGYAIFGSDDGATTVPKLGLRFIGNMITTNQSGTGAVMGFDYATASSYVDVEDNTIIGGNSAGTSTGLVVIAGLARYNWRNNSFAVGSGNMQTCMDILGGTPVVNLWSFDNKDVATDLLHPTLFNLIDCQRILTGSLTLTGCTTSPATTYRAVKRGKSYVMQIDGISATSNATTCTLTGLPAELFPSRNLNYRFPVIDNAVNLDGLLQVTAAGAINLFKDINATAFTNVGTKGLPGPYSISVQMT